MEPQKESPADPHPTACSLRAFDDRCRPHPNSADSYTGTVLIVRFNGLRNPTTCVLVDLVGKIAYGIDIIDWYVDRYDVDKKGLGILRMPRTIEFV
jgi:hypothetical protein